MSGSLQGKMYGHQKHSATPLKKAGHYGGAPLRRAGHYNSAPKQLGHYNGSGGSRNNLTMEMYPQY
jgi:hypothetical protein